MIREKVLYCSRSIKLILHLIAISASVNIVFIEFKSILNDASLISFSLTILESSSDILELTAAIISYSVFERIMAICCSESWLIFSIYAT